MTRRECSIIGFGLFFLLSQTVFAETIEFVTYYPAPGAAGNEHVNDFTVGPGYLGENPAPGVALIETRLGIGTTNPQEQLHITGNLRLPPTTATTGIIMSGANRFIHNFGNRNFFAGVNAGNFTLTGTGEELLGPGNVGIGTNAMRSLTDGIQNVAVGPQAMQNNTRGQRNSAFGMESLRGNTTGHDNVAVGQNAGAALLANANTTGSGNTFIGTRSGSGTETQLNNATAIGFEALVSASNALVLGGTGASAVHVGIGTERPQATLDIVSDGGTILVPRRTAAGDPAAGINGMIYYNANAQRFRTYQDGRWQSPDGDWMLVYRDDFETQANANTWSPTRRTTIARANILGGYSTASTISPNLQKTFSLTGIPHTQIRVELDYYAIDSWDGEFAFVIADTVGFPTAIWSQRINQADPGRRNFSSSGAQTDGVYHALLTSSNSSDELTVVAGSTLNQAANDESFGIDNVEVWVR